MPHLGLPLRSGQGRGTRYAVAPDLGHSPPSWPRIKINKMGNCASAPDFYSYQF